MIFVCACVYTHISIAHPQMEGVMMDVNRSINMYTHTGENICIDAYI